MLLCQVAESALHAIADHGGAHGPADHEAGQGGAGLVAALEVDHQQGTTGAATTPHRPPKALAVNESVRGRQHDLRTGRGLRR